MYFEKEQFVMLVVLLPMFVADTYIIPGYTFIAPSRVLLRLLFLMRYPFTKKSVLASQRKLNEYNTVHKVARRIWKFLDFINLAKLT